MKSQSVCFAALLSGIFGSLLPLCFSQTEIVNDQSNAGPMSEIFRRMDESEADISEYERLNRDALRQMAERDYKKAFQLLGKAMTLEPESTEAYVNFGLAHYDREEYPSSEKALVRALEIEPTNAKAWHYYSKVLMLKGEPAAAIEAAQKSVEYDKSATWQYLQGLADIEYAQELFVRSAATAGDALEILNSQLAAIDSGILVEERKQQVAEIEHDTEIRTNPLGGEAVEIPITRLRMENADAPDNWYEMRDMFGGMRSEVATRRALAFLKLGRTEEAEALLPLAFSAERSRLDRGLMQFALRNYGEAVELLRGPGRSPNPSMEALLGLLLSEIATGAEIDVSRTLKKVKRKVRSAKSRWAVEALKYIGRSDPTIDAKGFGEAKPDGTSFGLADFYKAQFHFAQGYPELAAPLLKTALGKGIGSRFEARAAELQIALFFSS